MTMAADFLKQHGIDLQHELSKVQFGEQGAAELDVIASSSVNLQQSAVPLELIPSLKEVRESPAEPCTDHSKQGRDLLQVESSQAPIEPGGTLHAIASSRIQHNDGGAVLQAIHTIEGVILSSKGSKTLWDIKISAGRIISVVPHDPLARIQRLPPETLNVWGQVIAPSLCHPHVHLDKCFLLSESKYSDLAILIGDVSEAIALTAEAKARFEEDDLMRRGRWLITESVAAGVTCMRAFVEVDMDVRFKCLDAGLRLKEEFKHCCLIQLCVFAQEPILSKGRNCPEGMKLLEEALAREGVDVVGTSPYAEDNDDLMRANIDWAIFTALKYAKHLDLHLDDNFDPQKKLMIQHVIEVAKARSWPDGKTIVLGHCTGLTLFKAEEWYSLRTSIGELPVFFIGLPTSDLYRASRDPNNNRLTPGGTLQIPEMIKKYNINGAIGVDNVGNAFTMQGNCDPLSIASMGVGVYHSRTRADTELLYVSSVLCRKKKNSRNFSK